MKILLTCPACGSSDWLEETDDECAFVCVSCGKHVFPEDMTANPPRDGSKVDMDIPNPHAYWSSNAMC